MRHHAYSPVAIASKAQKGPLSREASEEELATAVKKAVDERFGRYDGDLYYHLGVSVEGYNIAVPGIPLVASPKSVMLLNVTVWDDAQNRKLTPEPHRLTVFESVSGDMVVGTGLTKTKEEQLENLARNAAKQIEIFLLKNREWFGTAPAPTSKAGGGALRLRPTGTAGAAPAGPAPEIAPTTAPAQAATPASTAPRPAASAVFVPVPEPRVIAPAE